MPLGANKAAIMGVAGVSTENIVLLSSQTESAVSAISFTSQLTSTYPIYVFKVYNLNPSSGNTYLGWQVNADGETGYNETFTATAFRCWQYEGSSPAEIAYKSDWDSQESDITSYMTQGDSADADSSSSGELWLFNPSSTTYVKHFMSRVIMHSHTHATTGPAANHQFFSGYINTTGAIDDIKFLTNATNMDVTIKLWGIK